MEPIILSKVTIRIATVKDCEELINLFDEITTSIQNVGGTWENYTNNSTFLQKKKVLNDILLSDSKVFIAEYLGKIIGAINLQIINNIRHGWKRAHLEEVIIEKNYRGKGVGSLLIQHIKDYCQMNNIKSIKLMCGKQLVNSQEFYEKNGFIFTDKGYRFELT